MPAKLRSKSMDAMRAMVLSIKGDEKAALTPAGTLQKIIDDYCVSGEFDDYLAEHAHRLQYYVPNLGAQRRPTRFRASSAGTCPQQQAYYVLEAERANSELIAQVDLGYPWTAKDGRVSPHYQRALYNGTFGHIRWHMMFDALHDRGQVETLDAEVLRVDHAWNFSGTIDRRVRFEFDGRPFTAVLDMKTMKERYFADLIKPKTEHGMQQHDYLLLKWEADEWMMLYENKDTHLLKVYSLPYSELVVHKLKSNYNMMAVWLTQVYEGVPVEKRAKLPLITDWCGSCPFLKMCNVENPQREQTPEHAEEIVF